MFQSLRNATPSEKPSFWNDEEDEEDQYSDTHVYADYQEYNIYAIDCSLAMWEEQEDNGNEPPVLSALKCIRAKLLDSLYLRPNDYLSIILYATEKHKNAAGKENITILQPLDALTPTRLKQLDDVVDDPVKFRQRYTPSADQQVPISDLLWICADVLSKAPRFSQKRIIIISNNDDPTYGDLLYKRAAIQRAKDLTGNGVNLVVFGLNRSYSNKFNKLAFYTSICKFEDDEELDRSELNEGEVPQGNPHFEFKLLSSTGDVKGLFEKLKTVQTKRPEFRLPFQMGPKLTIGVKGYNLIVKQKLPTPTHVYSSGEQLKEVKSTTQWKREDTDDRISFADLQYSYEYGGEDVVFTKEEVNQLKTVNEPGLYLLGFRDWSALKMHHQLMHPYFIYPDETQYIGSTTVFTSLLKSTLRKKKMAICNLTRKVNTMARLVALLPQTERFDVKGNVTQPAGFQAIILPFADEIRPIPAHTVPEEKELQEAVRAIKPIIRKLTTNAFNPTAYNNPTLQIYRNVVLHTALESERMPSIKDNTLPDYKLMNEQCGEDIEKFKRVVGLQTLNLGVTTEQTTAGRKRQVSRSVSPLVVKRPKLNERSIPDHFEFGSLKNVTNACLKDFLNSVGINPKQLKKDLIAQVSQYLRSKTASSSRPHEEHKKN